MKALFPSHYCPFERFHIAITGLLFCSIIVCGACNTAPVQPVPIGAEDFCSYCKAPVTDVAFSSEFIMKDGTVHKFDDIGCLVAGAKRLGPKNVRAYFARDIMSRTWLPAERLSFVRSSRIPTPNKTGIIAFKDAAKARQIASRYQAELLTLTDILK